MTFSTDICALLQEIENPIKPHITQLPGQGLRGVKNTIAIASGKGGVGKSTVAVNLATALQHCNARVGLLDADIYGPSIPHMLGCHAKPEVTEDNLLRPVEIHGLQTMSIGYLTDEDDPLIWRGPMLAKSLLQMLNRTLWQDLDYLFIDLPPGTGDIQLSLVQKIPLTGAITVTTPQQIATLDAGKALAMFAKTGIANLGIIENMSIYNCPNCDHREHLFGRDGAALLAEKFSCPVLGNLPFDTRIVNGGDSGIPVTGEDSLARAFLRIALQVALEIAKKPLNRANNLPPIVTS